MQNFHVEFHPNRAVRLTCTGRHSITAFREEWADFHETRTCPAFHRELLYQIHEIRRFSCGYWAQREERTETVWTHGVLFLLHKELFANGQPCIINTDLEASHTNVPVHKTAYTSFTQRAIFGLVQNGSMWYTYILSQIINLHWMNYFSFFLQI
jgi:hypothetical protein